MTPQFWQDSLLAPTTDDNRVWELFHENSKIDRYTRGLSSDDVRAKMKDLHESLSFDGYPVVDLPQRLTPLTRPLTEAITARVSSRGMAPAPLTLEDLATLLQHAYGITRDNSGTTFPRPFRAVPSGGALYPLEIFFHTRSVTDLQPGLYHYNPTKNRLDRMHEGDESDRIARIVIHDDNVPGASLVLFITAIFERSTFKYGARGYRFTLLEAGHVAQNLNLVATALGLGCLNIGGFYDREVDDYLGLDGLNHSTIYMIATGGKKEP